MSSHHDPFDLLPPSAHTDNVIPFLAPTRIGQMIDKALHTQQVKPVPRWFDVKTLNPRVAVKIAVSVAACLLLWVGVTMMPPDDSAQDGPVNVAMMDAEEPSPARFAVVEQVSFAPATPSVANVSYDDMNEFNEMVMLDTWDR